VIIAISALVSAALYTLSFPPAHQSWISWFAIVPFLVSIKGATRKQQLRGAFLLNFGIGVGCFNWVAHAVSSYGEVPYIVGILALFVFCSFNQLHWVFYIFARNWVMDKSPRLWLLGCGLVYAAIDMLYPKLFADSIGHCWYNLKYFRQMASLGSAYSIAALILYSNEILALTCLNVKAGTFKKSIKPLVVLAGCAIAVFFYGDHQYNTLEKIYADPALPHLRVSMIQANIGDLMKVAAEKGLATAGRQVVTDHLELSEEARRQSDPDLIVWPETAYPSLLGQPTDRIDVDNETDILMWKSGFRGTLAVGGYDRDDHLVEYNSLFFWGSNEPRPTTVYHKSILLMFGETLPFADDFPIVKKWIPNMGFFGRGHGTMLVELKNKQGEAFRLVPSICYEALYPERGFEAEQINADALINITNDSWFGTFGEPYLHLALTTFRATETNLSVLRTTNTGITTWIHPTGDILMASNLDEKRVVTVDLPRKSSGRTLISRFPHWFSWFSITCSLLLVVFLGVKRPRNTPISP